MVKREKFIRSIRKNGASFAINIPPEVMRVLDIKENDLIRVEIERVDEK